jgi:trimeric autotransporter adhesin
MRCSLSLCALAACSVPLETFTPVDNTPTGGNAYLKASNADAGDHFGLGISLSPDGSLLIVGANVEASGVVGDPANNDAQGAGAAYVFVRVDGRWMQQAYLKASNPGMNDEFGLHVALSRDGSTLAIGAYHENSAASGVDGNQLDETKPKSGAVYMFRRTADTWTQEAYLKASNPDTGDFFGWAVALSSDGSTLAIGARHEDSNSTQIDMGQINGSATDAGAVYVFTRQATTWSQQAYVKSNATASYQGFGRSVALSGDGSLLVVGAPGTSSNQGAVYLFARATTMWSQQAALTASNAESNDQFGEQVAVTADGTQLAVSAVGDDSAATCSPN